MTERLTIKRNNGDCVLKAESCCYGWYSFDVQESLRKEGTEILKKAIHKLAEYETAEEEGRLLTLPCKPGNVVYVIIPSYTTCSKYGYVFDEYSCIRCEEYEEECDSHLEYYIWENKYTTLQWIIGNLERFGKTVFVNREEAEKAVEEMNKDIGTN